MTDYLKHITSEGDRWDLLAWQYYGDAMGYEPIIRANPDAPRVPVLPSGLVLLIPVVDEPETMTEDLPPWKL